MKREFRAVRAAYFVLDLCGAAAFGNMDVRLSVSQSD